MKKYLFILFLLLSSSCFAYNEPQSQLGANSATSFLEHFNEGSGSVVYDNSGNSIIGTAYNTAFGNTAISLWGSYIECDGVADYVSYGAALGAHLGNTHCMSIWVYVADYTLAGLSFFAGNHDPSYPYYNGFYLALSEAGKFQYYGGDGKTWAIYVAIAPVITTNGWFYVVGVHDASVHNIYVYQNGELIRTATDTGGSTTASLNPFYIARNPDGYGFFGATCTCDELNIENIIPTMAELQARSRRKR